jgi:hypothetical protein
LYSNVRFSVGLSDFGKALSVGSFFMVFLIFALLHCTCKTVRMYKTIS